MSVRGRRFVQVELGRFIADVREGKRRRNVKLILTTERLVLQTGVISKKTYLDLPVSSVIEVAVEEHGVRGTLLVEASDGSKFEIGNLAKVRAEYLASLLNAFAEFGEVPSDAFLMPYMGGHSLFPVSELGAAGIFLNLQARFVFLSITDMTLAWTLSIPFPKVAKKDVRIRETETRTVSQSGQTWTGVVVTAQQKQRANELVIPYEDEEARHQEPRFLLPQGGEGREIVVRVNETLSEKG